MTSKSEIAEWLNSAKKQGCTHMIVATDTFDHEDYPIFCSSAKECLTEFSEHDNKNMQRVMEVYDLAMDIDSQLAERRAFHLPEGIAMDNQDDSLDTHPVSFDKALDLPDSEGWWWVSINDGESWHPFMIQECNGDLRVDTTKGHLAMIHTGNMWVKAVMPNVKGV